MDDNTALILGGLIVALIVTAILIGRRIRRAKFSLGPFGETSLEGPTGPVISENVTEGEQNALTAKGPGAEIVDNVTKGKGNTLSAGP